MTKKMRQDSEVNEKEPVNVEVMTEMLIPVALGGKIKISQ